MTRRLVLYIDESWPAQPSAAWILLDDRDSVLESGRSEPRHWPAANECELVVGGPQCTWLKTRLPKSARRERERLLHYALEGQLIGDVDHQHVTVTAREPLAEGILASVLVISKARLRTLIAQLEAIGRTPARAVSELQSSALSPERWTLSVGPDGGWILRTHAHHALALDPGSAIDTIGHLLQTARGAGVEPGQLEIRCADDVAPPDPAALSSATGITATAGPGYTWWAALHACDDLLHDEFEPQRARANRLSALRAPLLVTVAALGLFLLVSLIEVAWQKQQLADLEDRMHRLFVTSVPNAPPIAPARQLRRALDDARSRHGQLQDKDLLGLLERYTDLGGTATRKAVKRIEYDDGSLAVTLDPLASSALPALEARLNALGFATRAASDGTATLTMTRRTAP